MGARCVRCDRGGTGTDLAVRKGQPAGLRRAHTSGELRVAGRVDRSGSGGIRNAPVGRPTVRWHAVGSKERRIGGLGVAGSLLICQTVFMVVDDAPIPSSSSAMYPPVPAVTTLQRAVGSSLVGLDGDRYWGGLGVGLSPNTNVSYGIRRVRRIRPHRTTELLQYLGRHQPHVRRSSRGL